MNLAEAAKLARTEMDYYGLYAWRFQFDRAAKRFGCCKHSARTLSLSETLVSLNTEEKVHDTILHEIAHALVGSGHGHDAVWKAKAREIGAKPDRCFDSTVTTPEAPYKAVCNCGTIFQRHRRTTRRFVCRVCKAPINYTLISMEGIKNVYARKKEMAGA